AGGWSRPSKPMASVLPSAAAARALTAPDMASVLRTFPLAMSQSLTACRSRPSVPFSVPATASPLLPDRKASARTSPRRGCNGGHSAVAHTTHTRTHPATSGDRGSDLTGLPLPAARSLPSGEYASARTAPAHAGGLGSGRAVCASHTLIVPSAAPEANVLPSGEYAVARMLAVWPRRGARAAPGWGGASQTFKAPPPRAR